MLDLSYSLLKNKIKKSLQSCHSEKLPSWCSPLDIMCIILISELGIDLKMFCQPSAAIGFYT